MIQPASSKTLLVVDPCPETQALALEQAKSRGLSVITAPDLHGAMAMLDLTVPDVVLSDLCLPERTGLSMIRDIRKRCSHTALIAMAEQGSDATILEALRAGAIDYLYKPVIGVQLGMALDRALQGNQVDEQPGLGLLHDQSQMHAADLRRVLRRQGLGADP